MVVNIENVTVGLYVIESVKAIAIIIIAFTYLSKNI